MNQPAANQPLPAPIIWGETNVGKQRSYNEDQIYPDMRHKTSLRPPTPQAVQARGYLMVVADGIGGAQVGDTAANFAVRSTVDHYYADPRPLSLDKLLQSAVEIANTNVYNYVRTSPAIQQAGCTLTAAAIRGNELVVAHVGDSRAYLVQDGAIYPITTDHNVAQLMVSGQPLPGGGQGLAGNMLVRSLGAGPAVEVETKRFLLKPGDTVLVCSDGLHGVMSNDEILQIASRETPQKGARKLIDLANARGGPDNISVVIARMPGGAAAAAPAAAKPSKRITALAIGVLALLGVLAVMLFAINRLNPPETTETATALVEVVASAPSRETDTAEPAETTPAAGATEAATSAVVAAAPTAATATQSASRAPTSTPAISHTPTPTPTWTPRPTQPLATAPPTGVPGPTAASLAPVLSVPPDGSEQRDQVTFQWTHGGLKDGQRYRIDLRTEHQQENMEKSWTSQSTSLTVRYDQHSDFFKDDGSTFSWSVVVVNDNGPLSNLRSEEWRFVMRRGSAQPPTSAPPPIETPTPAPPPTETPTPAPPPTETPTPAPSPTPTTRS